MFSLIVNLAFLFFLIWKSPLLKMNCNCKYKCFIGVTIDFKHKIIKANPPNTKIIKLSYLMSSRIKTFLIDFITYFSVLPWIFKFYIFEKKKTFIWDCLLVYKCILPWTYLLIMHRFFVGKWSCQVPLYHKLLNILLNIQIVTH